MKIKVRFTMDSLGSVTAWPVSDKHRREYAEHMRQFLPNDDGTVYIQNAGEESFSGLIPPRKIKDLMDGWDVVCLMDSYDYGMMLGYDAHRVELKK